MISHAKASLVFTFLLTILMADWAYANAIHQVDQAYEVLSKRKLIRGASVAIVSPNLPTPSVALGYGDATADSLLEIGSISKSFTGIAIALLSEQKKVDLEAPISTYVPELKGTFIGTTTAHLLATHSAQLVGDFKGQDQADEKILIQFLKDYKPTVDYPVGKRQYSNLGFDTLALIIRRVSGNSFESFVRENIFKPIGMVHSGFILTKESVLPLIEAYDPLLRPTRKDTLSDLDAGSGGIFSNAQDMLLYLKANLSPQSIPTLTNAILLSQKLGLGWDSLSGDAWVQKNGGMTGYGSLIQFNTEAHYGAVVMVNSRATMSAMSLCDVAVGKPGFVLDFPPTHAKDLVGEYLNAKNNYLLTVFSDDQGYLDLEISDVKRTWSAPANLYGRKDGTFKVMIGHSDADRISFAISSNPSKTKLNYATYLGQKDGKPHYENLEFKRLKK